MKREPHRATQDARKATPTEGRKKTPDAIKDERRKTTPDDIRPPQEGHHRKKTTAGRATSPTETHDKQSGTNYHAQIEKATEGHRDGKKEPNDREPPQEAEPTTEPPPEKPAFSRNTMKTDPGKTYVRPIPFFSGKIEKKIRKISAYFRQGDGGY